MTRGSLKMRTMLQIQPPVKIESLKCLGRLRSFGIVFWFSHKEPFGRVDVSVNINFSSFEAK